MYSTYKGLTKYEWNQNISPDQEVGLESINIDTSLFCSKNWLQPGPWIHCMPFASGCHRHTKTARPF